MAKSTSEGLASPTAWGLLIDRLMATKLGCGIVPESPMPPRGALTAKDLGVLEPRRLATLEATKRFGASLLAAVAVTVGFACGAEPGTVPALQPGGSGPDGGGAPDGAGLATTTGLPCEVSQVLSANCQTCHGPTPQSGASISLVTWNDLHQDLAGKKAYELVEERIHSPSQPMPPAARLTAAQLQSIDGWVAAGAPSSNATCDIGQGPPPATHPFECPAPAKVSVLKAAQPFTWTDQSAKDRYMCFGVDDVVDAKRHVIAFGPKVDNLNILHHILLFQTDVAESNEARPCSAATSVGWKLVTGWAPGGGNFELPPEAGVPEEGTTHWVLQVHYNNASGTHDGESDDSGYQLCSTDQLRPNDAGILAFGSLRFMVPPRSEKYRIKCDYTLGSQFEGVRFFRAWPHMHLQGMAVATERLPGGIRTPEPVFSQDPFSFENQESHPIDTKVDPGDVLRTRCTWKNPGDLPLTFGENTEDEMCFNFLSFYPANNLSWLDPSFGASCVTDN